MLNIGKRKHARYRDALAIFAISGKKHMLQLSEYSMKQWKAAGCLKLIMKMELKKKQRSMGVPKFIRHLYCILTNEDASIMTWSADGMSIQLYNVKRLESEVLPKYFRHNKLSSFQRQLNYFGFRKWTKTQSCVCTFSHAELNKFTAPDQVLISRKKDSFQSYAVEEALVFSQDILSDLFACTDEESSDDLIQDADWELCLDMINCEEDWFKSDMAVFV